MRIFLTRKFKKNDYSELMIYDQNEEVIASIFPKYGRLVVWNDTYDFAFRPPSVNVEQAEYSLLIKATENISKANDYEEKFQVRLNYFSPGLLLWRGVSCNSLGTYTESKKLPIVCLYNGRLVCLEQSFFILSYLLADLDVKVIEHWMLFIFRKNEKNLRSRRIKNFHLKTNLMMISTRST